MSSTCWTKVDLICANNNSGDNVQQSFSLKHEQKLNAFAILIYVDHSCLPSPVLSLSGLTYGGFFFGQKSDVFHGLVFSQVSL